MPNLNILPAGTLINQSLPAWAGSLGTPNMFPMPTPPTGKEIVFKKRSKFMKALNAMPIADFISGEAGPYYKQQTFGNVIEYMNFNPMWNGRPRKEVNWLLLSAPSPIKLFGQSSLYHYGLVTYEPAIANRRKTRCRLSYVGMELLDFWATEYPKFKPFVDAYLTKKARGEIASDALGYKLGFVPKRFEEYHRIHAEEVAKNRNTPNRRKYHNRMMRKYNDYSSQQAQITLLQQQQMVQAQARYNNMLVGQSIQQGTVVGMASPQTAVYASSTDASQLSGVNTTQTTAQTSTTQTSSGFVSAIRSLLGRK